MEVFEAISTKLEQREFAQRKVPGDVKRRVLEAARLTGSSMNSQHWRFVIVQDKVNLARLAADSTTGKWVEGADFAVMILVDPKVPGSSIDSGRALQDMQLAAWGSGVASGIYTGVNEASLRRDFGVPEALKPGAILGFGYPKRRITGKKKNRKPMEELAFSERFGEALNPSSLG